MIKTKVTVTIDRPVHDVFAYVADVANFPNWFVGVIGESRLISAGPIGKGSTFRQAGEFLGRRFDLLFQVTEYALDQEFCVATSWGVLPFQGCFSFAPAGAGTLLTDRHGIMATGVFSLVGSLLAARLKQQAETNLAHLKRILEGDTTIRGM